MKPFCETVVQSVVPGVRALLSRELMDKHGMTQQETANRLGITQAAVSQYRRSLRGFNIRILENNEDIMKEIAKFAQRLSKSPVDAVEGHMSFCDICRIIRSREVICALHKEKYPGLDKCNICVRDVEKV